jgi:hypothetical protein
VATIARSEVKFLLERKLRHEDRAADQNKCEDQQDVEDFEARQLSECIGGDSANPPERKGAISCFH